MRSRDDAIATRVRTRYTKAGKLRLVSALDLGRVWQRAVRRADLPIAYSEGFSPHPRISFPDALALGCASTGEYAELTFAAPIAVAPAVAALNEVFPDGMRVLAAAAVPDGAPKLSRWLVASAWDLHYPSESDASALGAAVGVLLDADAAPVPRKRRGDTVEVDVRPAIHRIAVIDHTVRAVTHHVEPPIRPAEIHASMERLAGGLPEPALVTRLAQGHPADRGLVEALSGELVEVPAPARHISDQRIESEHRERRSHQ
jgi:radical SAM-linked protein